MKRMKSNSIGGEYILFIQQVLLIDNAGNALLFFNGN